MSCTIISHFILEMSYLGQTTHGRFSPFRFCFPETAINTKDSKCQSLVIKAEVTLYILTMSGFITEN